MASKIQPQRAKIILKTPLNSMNKNPEAWENIRFFTEYELETPISRFFYKIQMENTLPEESETEKIESMIKRNSEPRIPMKKT